MSDRYCEACGTHLPPHRYTKDDAFCGSCNDAAKTAHLKAEVERLTRERDEARADNAALLQALLDAAELRLPADVLDAMAQKLRAEHHPGSALLREVQTRREACEAATRMMATVAGSAAYVDSRRAFLDACAEADRERQP